MPSFCAGNISNPSGTLFIILFKVFALGTITFSKPSGAYGISGAIDITSSNICGVSDGMMSVWFGSLIMRSEAKAGTGRRNRLKKTKGTCFIHFMI